MHKYISHMRILYMYIYYTHNKVLKFLCENSKAKLMNEFIFHQPNLHIFKCGVM